MPNVGGGRETSVSWYPVREEDGSGDSALGLIGRSLEEINDY